MNGTACILTTSENAKGLLAQNSWAALENVFNLAITLGHCVTRSDFSFRVGNCSLGCRTRSLTFCALNVLDQKSSAADTVGSRAWPTYQECHGQPSYLNLRTPKWQAPTELPTKLAHTTQTESWRPFSFMNKSGGSTSPAVTSPGRWFAGGLWTKDATETLLHTGVSLSSSVRADSQKIRMIMLIIMIPMIMMLMMIMLIMMLIMMIMIMLMMIHIRVF